MQFQSVIDFIQDKFSSKGFIPLHAPTFNGNEKKYILETINSTFVSSVGAYVDMSENLMSSITGSQRSVAVVNGTSGLQIALKVCGVSNGDEVITQALTFVATANAISFVGATPIFLDVDYDTMGLSPTAVKYFLEENAVMHNHITYNKKTGKRISACVPMHTFGFPVHMNELIDICRKWNIPIVEDSAESLGSYYYGKHTGTFGETGVFSFNGNKIVTSGGGGMIVFQNVDLAKRAKHITTTAKIPHEYEFFHDMLGYNFRLPNLNAALCCAQLEQLDLFLANKRNLAFEYATFFENSNIKFRKELENTKSNYWLMCVEFESLSERDHFLKMTNKNNVMTRPIWQLMFRLPMYKECYRDDQKNAIFLEERIVNIPSSVRI